MTVEWLLGELDTDPAPHHNSGHSQEVNSFTTKSKGTWGGADKDLAKQVREVLDVDGEVDESLWANIAAKRKRIKAGSGEKMRKPMEKRRTNTSANGKSKNGSRKRRI